MNDNIVHLEISELEIKQLIKKTLSENFNKRDNLRSRHSNVQFDCLLRGYIGELGIVKWFSKYGITFDKSNYLEDDQGNIDIDLLFRKDEFQLSLEIKTSLIPDNYVKNIDTNDIDKKIEKCFDTFDIKLIRRNNESIEELKGDIHIQIYFADLRKAKDNFLNNVLLTFNINNKNINESMNILTDKIYETLHSNQYIQRSFFLSWIDKKTLINQINKKSDNDKTWSFPGSKRQFWTCKMKREGKKPMELIEYLNNFNGDING